MGSPGLDPGLTPPAGGAAHQRRFWLLLPQCQCHGHHPGGLRRGPGQRHGEWAVAAPASPTCTQSQQRRPAGSARAQSPASGSVVGCLLSLLSRLHAVHTAPSSSLSAETNALSEHHLPPQSGSWTTLRFSRGSESPPPAPILGDWTSVHGAQGRSLPHSRSLYSEFVSPRCAGWRVTVTRWFARSLCPLVECLG